MDEPDRSMFIMCVAFQRVMTTRSSSPCAGPRKTCSGEAEVSGDVEAFLQFVELIFEFFGEGVAEAGVPGSPWFVVNTGFVS